MYIFVAAVMADVGLALQRVTKKCLLGPASGNSSARSKDRSLVALDSSYSGVGGRCGVGVRLNRSMAGMDAVLGNGCTRP